MAGPATSVNIAPITSFVEKATLAVAKPLLTISKFGMKKTIPTKNSKTIVVSRVERLAPLNGYGLATTKALVEGVVPSTVNPTRTDITISLAQYGNLSSSTDIANWINEHDVDQAFVERNSQNMVETVERVYWSAIVGGTNVFRLTDAIGGVSGAARVNVAGVINGAALDKAIRNLRVSDAKPITGNIMASTKVGTQGVREAYICVIHPRVEYDLNKVVGFVPVTSYGSMDGVYPGECGAYKNIRFIVSTMCQAYADAGAAVAGTYSTTGTNNDVFICMIFGKDAYAVVDLASSSETTYIAPGTKSAADPLGQLSFIGWKAMCGGGILDDNWLLRMEVAATA